MTVMLLLRQVAYAVWIVLAMIPLGLALLLLAVSIVLSVLAYAAWPNPTWGNCWTWAASEWWHRTRQWVRDGMPAGLEPRIMGRTSRRRPRILPHVLLAYPLDRWSDVMLFDSYKPDAPTDEPWWRAWLHMGFRGRVRAGDVPTRPSDSQPPA